MRGEKGRNVYGACAEGLSPREMLGWSSCQGEVEEAPKIDEEGWVGGQHVANIQIPSACIFSPICAIADSLEQR